MRAAGADPDQLGPDEELLAGLGSYVELHIEQGRALADLGAPIGVAEGDLAARPVAAGLHRAGRSCGHRRRWPTGVTPCCRTRRPCSPPGRRRRSGAPGRPFGKVVAEPGAANAMCSSVRAWLDVRAPDGGSLAETVEQVLARPGRRPPSTGGLDWQQESFTDAVEFDAALRDRLAAALAAAGFAAPVLPTGAGHDAGVLAARLPTAMLFVRNPPGVSHAPAEHADEADCEAGVRGAGGRARATWPADAGPAPAQDSSAGRRA